MLKIRGVALALAVALSGCAAPSLRGDHEGNFKFRAAGQIEAGEVPVFMDCVLDGFMREQRHVNALVWQYKRSTGYRVDLKTEKYLLLSADINDDGRTQLVEGPAAGMIPTGAEIEQYEACVRKFGKLSDDAPK